MSKNIKYLTAITNFLNFLRFFFVLRISFSASNFLRIRKIPEKWKPCSEHCEKLLNVYFDDMFVIVLTSFISGVVFILLVELIFIYQWWIRKPKETPTHKVTRPKVRNPEVYFLFDLPFHI